MSGRTGQPLRFSKMHGAGNDFVVVDCREHAPALTPGELERLADRHRGIGFDQLLTIEPPRTSGAALAYRIWNSDGSEARQCGNGARCVAAWARRAGLGDGGSLVMDSPAGRVEACFRDDGEVEIELAAPDFAPAAVPYRGAVPGALDVDGRSITFTPVSIGNPHAVIAVDAVANAAVARIGAALQSDQRFPQSCNVGFAEVVDRDHVRLRVFERGVGETLACGSGACAAMAVLSRAGRIDADADIELPGGTLHIHWPGGAAPMRMRGPATFVFEGEITP